MSDHMSDIEVTPEEFHATVEAAIKIGAPIREDYFLNQETFTFALAWLVGVADGMRPKEMPAWGIPR